jgi:hypothetical protein
LPAVLSSWAMPHHQRAQCRRAFTPKVLSYLQRLAGLAQPGVASIEGPARSVTRCSGGVESGSSGFSQPLFPGQ